MKTKPKLENLYKANKYTTAHNDEGRKPPLRKEDFQVSGLNFLLTFLHFKLSIGYNGGLHHTDT